MGRKTAVSSGIRERNGRIEIDFYYGGVRCRETLLLEPNPKNLKYAAQLRAAILFEISLNKFDYATYFPSSQRVKQFATAQSFTMDELLNRQIELYTGRESNGNMSISTLQGYVNSIQAHLIPSFGKYDITELTPMLIKDWIYSLNCSAKTIRNTLIPLSKVLKTALNDRVIKSNPLEDLDLDEIIKDIAKPSIREKIDPFSTEEKEYLINIATGQLKNIVQFNFWAGLRTGELIALRWQDIDLENRIIHVKHNIVRGKEKAPKTKSGVRKIIMLPQAEIALIQQFEITGRQNDFVFHNPTYNLPWANDQAIRQQWQKLFKDGKVRYRYFYQTRHTYASTLLTNGENIAWIATQLGHINTEMVIKSYGKFIPDSGVIGGYKMKGNY
ncbi:MAG: site-specific integrase [Burkholderiales bacterium]|nr:site-specific integrase [Burkholderiales bacterium]